MQKVKLFCRIFVLIAVAIFSFLALISFHVQDTSFNSATTLAPQNMMGPYGAYTADFLWQYVGLSALFIPFFCSLWAWHLAFQQDRPFTLKKVCFVIFLPLSCFLLAHIHQTTLWDLPLGLCGYVGFYLKQVLAFLPWYVLSLLWGCFFILFFYVFPLLKPLTIVCKKVFKLCWKKPLDLPEPVKQSLGKIKTIAPKKRESKKNKDIKTAPVKKKLSDFVLPPADLLNPVQGSTNPTITGEAMRRISSELEGILGQFGINGKVIKANPGPVVTLYEFEPASGVKTARVIALADDIAREMRAVSVRIAVIPGSNSIGIEMPNQKRDTVFIRELIDNIKFTENPMQLPLVLGKNIGGTPVYADLAKMPHLLVAGTTGSGKSVAINTMILSLLYRFTPNECRLIMVDPKMVELSVYNGIPHLLTPVITEPAKALVGLKWAVQEMEERYRAMSAIRVRNIEGYNQALENARNTGTTLTRHLQTGFDSETGKPIIEERPIDLTPMPYIVFIIDEMADLMGQCGKEADPLIQRLAQMARAVGIHLILATQRPSVDVITGTIKSNFPSRISFQVRNKIDSRTILDEMGAEQLLGKGDMLYMPAGAKPIRIHGPFVSDEEVNKVVAHLKTQGEPQYVEAVTAESDGGSDFVGAGANADDTNGSLYDRAVAIVLRDKKPTTSYVQRQLRIGYNKAADLIDKMEAEGILSKPNVAGKREILVPTDNA